MSVHYAGQGAIGRNPPFMPTQDFQPGRLFVGRNVADGLRIPVPTPLDTAARLNAAGGSIYAVQLDHIRHAHNSTASTSNGRSRPIFSWMQVMSELTAHTYSPLIT